MRVNNTYRHTSVRVCRRDIDIAFIGSICRGKPNESMRAFKSNWLSVRLYLRTDQPSGMPHVKSFENIMRNECNSGQTWYQAYEE